MITEIIIVSLFCNGIYLLFDDGMLLNPVKKWFVALLKGSMPSHASTANEPMVIVDPVVNKASVYYEYFTQSFEQKMESYEKRGEWIIKPLVGCVYCMASFWGSIGYWLVTIFVYHHGVNIQALVAWPLVCIACIFVNGLFFQVHKRYEGMNG